jgi:phosphoesterase RecJ-like protein
MQKFAQEFKTLNYVIKESSSILLFAHTHPDGDTTGANLAMREYIKNLGKKVDIACYDTFPEYLRKVSDQNFIHPHKLVLENYDLIIACDSVARGFDTIQERLGENQVTALIDHHPDIHIRGDINIIDATFSSACEIVYHFFMFNNIELTRPMANFIMLGILSDTGSFQHSNTTPQVMEIASHLIMRGSSTSKIIENVFAHKEISTLKLWGKAFEKAKINPENGMIASALTKKDLEECNATTDDIAQVAGILNAVPNTKFSLILSERDGGMIKGSLRSEEYKGTDVSAIAAGFGGGGHKLASGFEIKGKIKETKDGWEIV